jgi:hypothetical protein
LCRRTEIANKNPIAMTSLFTVIVITVSEFSGALGSWLELRMNPKGTDISFLPQHLFLSKHMIFVFWPVLTKEVSYLVNDVILPYLVIYYIYYLFKKLKKKWIIGKRDKRDVVRAHF